ncbi:MAG: hypothetical protein AB1439_12300 [candidate division FCPU426 bacterium]
MRITGVAVSLFLALGLTGCGGTFIKKPAVLDVKKLAIVSVYANTDIHDVEAKESGTKVNLLKALVAATAPEKDIETDEQVQLVTMGLKSFGEALSGVEPWSLVPPDQVIRNKKFQALTKPGSSAMGDFLSALRKAATASWVTPPGMPYIPASSVTHGNKSVTIMGQKDPVVEGQEKLAALCKDLNVDAVAVIGLDLAYKKGWLSGMSGTGIFSGVLGQATPVVACEMVVVTRNGQIAVETPLFSQGGGKHEEGPGAPMLKKGRPYLKDSKQEAVNAYAKAITKSAAVLRDVLVKELSQ